MHWTIAAPFIAQQDGKDASWLNPYVPGKRHTFTVIPREKPMQSWHERTSKFTGVQEWLTYWQQGADAIKATRGGVITVFPQLAAVVGMQQRLHFQRHIPVVAWLYNVGTCHDGLRQQLSKISMQNVDRFVVHTRRECEIYSQWMNLPIERFEFVPYQVPEIPITEAEETVNPFVTSLGSAHRDFPTLFQAVERLNLPTIVASGKAALSGLTIPSQVQTPFGIGKADCLKLAQQARINVVPLRPNDKITAAGQVTIVEAMRMGRAVIATRCLGAEDYIIDGETGLLVEPHSVEQMQQAIEKLWHDQALRERLGAAARQYAVEHFSDEAAGRALGKVLDSIADGKAGRRSALPVASSKLTPP